MTLSECIIKSRRYLNEIIGTTGRHDGTHIMRRSISIEKILERFDSKGREELLKRVVHDTQGWVDYIFETTEWPTQHFIMGGALRVNKIVYPLDKRKN